MKKSIIFLSTTLLIASLASCATAEVDTTIDPLSVLTVSPSMEDFSTMGSTVASLEPGARVTVAPGISGEVEKVFVSLGDYVEVGDLLCIVDSEQVEDQCETAEDGVQRALEAQQTIVESTLVKAPVSGYVQSIDESIGHAISGSTQLAFLSNQQEMTVKLPFLASAVQSSWMGATANLTFVDTGEKINGRVSDVSGSAEFLYGNVSVKYVTISVDNPGGIQDGRRVAGEVKGVGCSGDGVFESQANSPVISGLAGTLTSIYVSNGDFVNAGTPMFSVTNASTDSQLRNAVNTLSDAMDAREDAYELLADYRVTATLEGTVSDVYVKYMDMLSPSSAVAEISATDKGELSFSVSEVVMPYLTVGQPLYISSSTGEVEGQITEISTVANGQTGLFAVKGVVVGEDVLTGTSAQVTYTDFIQKNALVIPFQAMQFIGESAYVFVVEDGIALRQEVEFSRFSEEKVIITQGLSPEDVVIASWSTQLRHGLAVAPIIEGEPEETEGEVEQEEGDREEEATDVSD